jgi:acetyl esterase/lipase
MRRSAARAVLVAATALSVLCAAAGCGESGPDDLLPTTVGGARVSWGQPDGTPAGLVMLLHGGGWQRSDSGYEEQKEAAKALEEEGYTTVAVGYDEGATGFSQVVQVYRTAREHYPNLPICATGLSAGGHLALMLATREPDLTCVVTLSAPTDLTTLGEQDPEGDEAYEAAVTAFGKDQLAKFSPVRYADRIRAKVLMIQAEDDPLDPPGQGQELAQALPAAQFLLLPSGPVPAVWAHGGGVQEDAQDIVIERELEFLKEAFSR